MQRAWLFSNDAKRHTALARYILPINAIICVTRDSGDEHHLRPSILHTMSGLGATTVSTCAIQNYHPGVLLEKYDRYVVEDAGRIEGFTIDVI